MASRYAHGHQYDIFVSYSTRDLEWVRPFYEDLVEDVNRFADFDICPYFDKARLEPGYVWNEELLAAAADSALLIPILSPRYFQSDYCQKEVKAFLDAHGLMSGPTRRSRILPVKLLSAAPADHLLAQLQATVFCKKTDGGLPFEYAPESAEYKEALRTLAFAIAQTLKTVPPKSQRRAAVYLAPDFRPATEKLRLSLQHHFEVLPEDPADLMGLPPAELRQSLERDFARCFVSVHPLNDSPFAKPLIDTILEFAKTANKPRLVWTPTRSDELANAGFEWFTSQADIEDRIRSLHEKPPTTKAPNADCLIYFLCPDRANKSEAEPLLAKLEQRGVRIYASPLEGSADQAMHTHTVALDELDGCLIYYGNVDRAWFDAVFLKVRRKIRQRQLPAAIFVAPPPSEHKSRDLQTIGVPVLDEPEAAVRTFLRGAP